MLSPLGARLLDGREANGTVGVVLIGMEEDEKQFLVAVRSGVPGYLLNDASASDVVTAVRAAARGEAVCPPRLCLALFHALARLARETPAQIRQRSLPGLTIRQQQLISLVAKGFTNKEIASRLNLSEFTIKNHMHRIMKQVEAVSRHEAVEAPAPPATQGSYSPWPFARVLTQNLADQVPPLRVAVPNPSRFQQRER